MSSCNRVLVWLVLALSACMDSAYIADPSTDASIDVHRVVDAAGGDRQLLDRGARLDVTSSPDTSTPDTSTPDTAAPDTSTPDTSTPDTSTPDTAAPDTSTPDTSTPDTSTPDASDSGNVPFTTIELPPSDDAWLRQGSPDTAGGDSTHMTVGYCTSPENLNMKVWLKFELSALPQEARILVAEVQLYFYDRWNSQPYPVHLSVEDGWGEQSITWNSQPTYDPQVLDTVAAFTEKGLWKSWDVTAATIQEHEGDGTISLVLEGETLFDPTSSPADAENRAYSKEHEDLALAPRLAVSYLVP